MSIWHEDSLLPSIAAAGEAPMSVAAIPADITTPTKTRGYSTAWWGMVVLIATEAMVFAVLLSAYFFLRAASKEWPIGGLELPELRLTTIFSFVLWGSSIPIFWAEAGIRRGNVARLRAGLLISM